MFTPTARHAGSHEPAAAAAAGLLVQGATLLAAAQATRWTAYMQALFGPLCPPWLREVGPPPAACLPPQLLSQLSCRCLPPVPNPFAPPFLNPVPRPPADHAGRARAAEAVAEGVGRREQAGAWGPGCGLPVPGPPSRARSAARRATRRQAVDPAAGAGLLSLKLQRRRSRAAERAPCVPRPSARVRCAVLSPAALPGGQTL